jgi:hypothetical protein
MSNSFYKKYTTFISKIFFGIDASIGHAILALFIIIALFLASAFNASSLVSLVFEILRQKSSGILFYLSAFAMTGVVFGIFWNLISVFGKKIKSTRFILQPQIIGTLFLSYFLLIISSFSLVLKINYTDVLKRFEDLVTIYKGKTTNDLYLYSLILITQILLIAYILIQRRMVIDSVTNKMIEKKAQRYERKAKEYDLVYDHYFFELKHSKNDMFTKTYTALLSDSNKNTFDLDWNSNNNKLVEQGFLENIENSNINLYRTFERLRGIDKEKGRELQIKIFKGVIHELGNKIPIAKDDLEQVMTFLKLKHPNILDENLKETSRPQKIMEILTRMGTLLSYSNKMLGGMEKIIKCDPAKMERTEIGFKEFVTTQFNSFKFKNGNVGLNFDEISHKTLFVSEIQFELLLQCLFENADRHGFIEQKNYRMLFKLTKNDNKIILEIQNNGNRFPDDFTAENYITPSKYLGATGNTGLGGYLINLVINNHGGELIDIGNLDEKSDLYSVYFKISLPINANYYELKD